MVKYTGDLGVTKALPFAWILSRNLSTASFKNHHISHNFNLHSFCKIRCQSSKRLEGLKSFPSPHVHGPAVTPAGFSEMTYFPHPPRQSDSACPVKPAGKARCPAPRQCPCPCWSGTWWPGWGGKRRWRCPQYWWMSSLGRLERLRDREECMVKIVKENRYQLQSLSWPLGFFFLGQSNQMVCPRKIIFFKILFFDTV